MASGGDIWEILGIAPTEDRRAIRSAYAARLKAIDPEADPKAFIALREALEAASTGGGTTWNFPEQSAPQPVTTGTAADIALERDCAELDRMLNDGSAGANAPELLTLVRRIWNNPACDHIGRDEWVEGWLAHLIADRLRWSDAIVEPSIKHYGWDRRSEEFDLPPELATILARSRDLAALAGITSARHRHYATFKMLERDPADVPEIEKRNADLSLRQLLVAIHDRYPTIEWHFGEARLRAWVEDIEAPRRRPFPLIGRKKPPLVYALSHDDDDDDDKPYGCLPALVVIAMAVIGWAVRTIMAG